MKSAMWIAVAAASAGVCASACRATLINFDDVASGTSVATQYPQAVFSSEPGLDTIAFAFLGPNTFSLPNLLTPYDAPNGRPTSVPDLYVDFTTPVNGLSFLVIAANEFGTVARVNVYSGATLLGVENIIGFGPSPGVFGNGSLTMNLGAYSSVTRIEIVPPVGQTSLDNSYNGGGLIYDDFSFEAVPAPGAAAMIAMGGMCAMRRRRSV